MNPINISRIIRYNHGEDDDGYFEKRAYDYFVVTEHRTQEENYMFESLLSDADCDSHYELEDVIRKIDYDSLVLLRDAINKYIEAKKKCAES